MLLHFVRKPRSRLFTKFGSTNNIQCERANCTKWKMVQIINFTIDSPLNYRCENTLTGPDKAAAPPTPDSFNFIELLLHLQWYCCFTLLGQMYVLLLWRLLNALIVKEANWFHELLKQLMVSWLARKWSLRALPSFKVNFTETLVPMETEFFQ